MNMKRFLRTLTAVLLLAVLFTCAADAPFARTAEAAAQSGAYIVTWDNRTIRAGKTFGWSDNGDTYTAPLTIYYSNADSMRVKRSAEFKSLIKSYQNSLSDEHLTSVPNSLEHILRDYQRTGLQWLTTLGVYRMGGILADDMGLGKTLQAIAFMLSEKTRGREKRQFLVVCPSSLVLNWQEEINRFAPKLKTLCLNGTVAERNAQFKTIDDCDVVITVGSLF